MYQDWTNVATPNRDEFMGAADSICRSMIEFGNVHGVYVIEQHVVRFLEALYELNPHTQYTWTARRFVDEYQQVVQQLYVDLGWNTLMLFVFHNAIHIFAKELCGRDPGFKLFELSVLNLAMHRKVYV